jgi:hypothetical protein
MSISTGASPLTPSEKLQQSIANPNASRATSGTASVQPATPQAAAQAQQGAAQAQPKEEPFNAPMLSLPTSPRSHEVLSGLTAAMADPTVNSGTASKLYQLHEMVLNAERSMIQAVIDGMLV